MPFKNIDTAILRSFVRVVELGTFKLAGEESNRTQSAISQQMDRLETELGLELFERVGRNKFVTKNGMKIYDLAKGMLQLNDAIIDQADILKRVEGFNETSKVQ
jgi:Transcriptional regulator